MGDDGTVWYSGCGWWSLYVSKFVELYAKKKKERNPTLLNVNLKHNMKRKLTTNWEGTVTTNQTYK